MESVSDFSVPIVKDPDDPTKEADSLPDSLMEDIDFFVTVGGVCCLDPVDVNCDCTNFSFSRSSSLALTCLLL